MDGAGRAGCGRGATVENRQYHQKQISAFGMTMSVTKDMSGR
jgi:hypothetical protein